jgi:hypothetical protein
MMAKIADIGSGPVDAGKSVDAVFQVDGMLADAQLVELRLDPSVSRAWLLLDLRGALQLRDGNVAVLMLDQVSELSWSAPRTPKRIAYYVSNAEFVTGPLSSVRMEFFSGGEFTATFASAVFYELMADSLSPVAADFDLAADVVAASLPAWDSDARIVGVGALR